MIILLTRKGNFAILSAMTRQWRIEFEGAYYHILSRGNEQRNIFTDNDDRISFLEILKEMEGNGVISYRAKESLAHFAG